MIETANMARRKAQTARNIKTISPKADAIATMKKAFLVALAENGGNVSRALDASGLARRTAYDAFRSDPDFADGWRDALERGVDDLLHEARRRAIDGDDQTVFGPDGESMVVKKRSDTLLIYLLKHGEGRMKWRGRLAKAGQAALDAVRTAAPAAGLTEEQIQIVQTEILEAFGAVSAI